MGDTRTFRFERHEGLPSRGVNTTAPSPLAPVNAPGREATLAVVQLTENQVAIQRMVAEFAKRELAEGAFQPESEEHYHARQRKLAQQGLLGMTAPVEH